MATKLEKMAQQLDANFRNCLDVEFEKRFGIKLCTSWDFASWALVSNREDGQDLTKEQKDFTTGYSEGYLAAMLQVQGVR
jgi:hypothetical protein